MGMSTALQWWEEWQLRILVLASLFVNYILTFSYTVRFYPKLRRFRVVVWLAYMGSDALAIYALATLFNRHKQTTMTTTTTATALEVVWVPVLIHLGGRSSITAYSLEDNELWKRQAITFVSQVTVALYVFCKWWSGEKRLLQAAVLLFVVGILKFGQKPWALKTASFNSMLDSIPVYQRQGEGDDAEDLSFEYYVHKAKDIVFFGGVGRPTSNHEGYLSFKEYARKAKEFILGGPPRAAQDVYFIFGKIDIAGHTTKMFLDMSPPYHARFLELQSFMKLSDHNAHIRLQRCLSYTFDLLYSRMRYDLTPLGKCLRFLIPTISIASLVLLAKSNMDGYDKNDARVTYILYYGNATMGFLPFLLTCMCMPFKCRRPLFHIWHDMVSQCSLMSFCARKRKPTLLMKLATFGALREYLNTHWYVQQRPVAGKITGLVHRHLIDGWCNHILNAHEYKRFNNIRRFDTQLRGLGWRSSVVPFDHSVLLWHIATDLCFHDVQDQPEFPRGEEQDTRRTRSREISNYMIYLLSARPEMLMPGTRPGLFAVAVKNVEDLKLGPLGLDTEESLAREIVKSAPSTTTYSVVHDARGLAVALMRLGSVERWMLIQRMWVEMLCYSAVRCRGYLHARSLGDGGECLTSVWLLWSFMGMETLADKLQRPQSSSQDNHGMV